MDPSRGVIGTGPITTGGSNADIYYGLTSFPTSFGTGTGRYADSTGSGSGLSIFSGGILPVGNGAGLFVPTGYQSGGAIVGSSVYANTDYTTLGVTAGRYEYSWAADSVILNINPIPPSAVPEVSATGSLAAIASLLALMAFLWERRRVSA